jgi:hypothetical protein
MRKCFAEPSSRVNITSHSMPISRPIASFIGDEAVEQTRDASRLFQTLGMVEIDLVGDIVREAIKFSRNAPQHLFYVRQDSPVRQLPGVPGLGSIMG